MTFSLGFLCPVNTCLGVIKLSRMKWPLINPVFSGWTLWAAVCLIQVATLRKVIGCWPLSFLSCSFRYQDNKICIYLLPSVALCPKPLGTSRKDHCHWWSFQPCILAKAFWVGVACYIPNKGVISKDQQTNCVLLSSTGGQLTLLRVEKIFSGSVTI